MTKPGNDRFTIAGVGIVCVKRNCAPTRYAMLLMQPELLGRSLLLGLADLRFKVGNLMGELIRVLLGGSGLLLS